MEYTLRPFRDGDAGPLASLTLAAIRAVGSARYSAEQVDAWAAHHPGPERFLERVAIGHAIFVAADSNDIAVAYSLLEPPIEQSGVSSGHLDMLYCHPDHTRRGLAKLLLTKAEEQARSNGVERLFTEASELAKSAFEKAGYKAIIRRDFTIEGPGGSVPIHNYAMEKSLII
ncbi:MAG: GNAT family N-acetyltransferase [Erythrobacter sp.]